MTVLWLSLILFLAYYFTMTTVSLLHYDITIAAILDGRKKRTSVYFSQMAGTWAPALAVLLLVLFQQFSFADVGLGWLKFNSSLWLVIVAAVLFILYFCYVIYSFLALRHIAIKKTGDGPIISGRMKALFPVTPQEKRVWALTAVSAGFTEELLFRGFLFYALMTLFPSLPILAVLAIASAIFGLGHLYQGPVEALKPFILGFVFGVFYVAFGSILPIIIVHALQDLAAVYAVNEESVQIIN